MATFTVWAKKRPVRRVAWVCGPEAALVAEVVAAHRDGAPDGQAVTLYAGDSPERDIWDQLLSCPVSGGRRAVVYGAERLARTGNVPELAEAAELGTAFAVLVSADADFPRDGTALAPHLAALQGSKNGQLIRCCEPGRLEDRIALVASWWPGASPVFAQTVLDRCGSLDEAWQACRTARLARLKPEPAMAAAVCPRSPAGDFSDRLIAGDKRGAMAAARELGSGEIAAVIGLTAFRLAVVEAVADGLRDGLSAREAAARAPGPRFAALQVSRHASGYSTEKVRRRREVLARADAAQRSGAPAGVAESLVAGW
jgi:hypothetical protein